MKRLCSTLTITFLLAACTTGCRRADEPSPNAPAAHSDPVEVSLVAKSGSKLNGKAVFRDSPEGVKVTIDVADVSPGQHATHVHERGDCSAPDATSAGPHFAPAGHPHGTPPTEPRHIGDFGNMTVGEDGRGHLETTAARANLRANDANSFIGRAIVVHAKPDDGSQPSGNAGDRIGCGEIKH
jgi:superoxide dismutase, Cu-Zn family